MALRKNFKKIDCEVYLTNLQNVFLKLTLKNYRIISSDMGRVRGSGAMGEWQYDLEFFFEKSNFLYLSFILRIFEKKIFFQPKRVEHKRRCLSANVLVLNIS